MTLKQYLDTVEQAVRAAQAEHGGPVILVAHSKGGGLAQCFLAQRPGQADGAVLMSALPLRRKGRFALSFVWRHISSLQTMREMIALVRVATALGRSRPVSADLVRRSALFSSRISETEAARYAPLLAQEPFRPSWELIRSAFRPMRVTAPVHTVASTGDHVFSPWEQKMLADAYGGQCVVLQDLCHDMMLDPQWHLAAEAVTALVKQIEKQTQAL